MHTQTVETDLLVVGGGLAGVSAAIAAARLGRRVALVNNRPVLGGNSSSEVRVWVCGATAHGNQRWAREVGIVGEMLVENQFRNPEGNPIYWDDVVLDLVRREKNIALFLNTDVREVQASGPEDRRRIDSVTGWTMGAEILTTFRAPLVVDATGDGLVGFLAGAKYRLGKEARAEFDEPWAPEQAVREFLGSTLLFYTRDMGFPVKFVAPDSAIDITKTPIPISRVIRSGDSGAHYWWVEWGGELDIVADNERIRDELRGVILGIWDHIKNSGLFDADNLTMEWIGNVPGKREYRRFIGDHTLTQHDVLEQRSFPDSVAYGGWSIDLHPAAGMYSPDPGAKQRFSNGVFEIPFRSLYSVNVENMFMAGRDFSATHVAFGAARVMATCAAMGEAVGTAAHLCLEAGASPRELAAEHPDRLQQLLLRQDANLIGVTNRDPEDLARSARVSASTWSRFVGTHRPDGAEITSAEGVIPTARDEFPLTSDVGIVVPVDPVLESVRIRVTALEDTEIEVQVWSPDLPQNVVPSHLEATGSLTVVAGPEQWLDLPTPYRPAAAGNGIVVLKANPQILLHTTAMLPPGVLNIVHRADADDQNVDVDTESLLMRWPTKPLRGRSVEFVAMPESMALAPERAVGGYQRPYGGPNMWASGPISETGEEWLRLDWDEAVEASELRLLFDVDLDVDLNTLHHHKTPYEVMPQAVRDYRIEVLGPGADELSGWTTISTHQDNRARQRVHDLRAAGAFVAIRLVVTRTNGVPQARVVSIRVQK
ncbi:FAD-dependent oxidoreductase [Tessaracoccus oleiagri]|uniref:FAD dependent oxidoreductase n=1 Tax=Tessaracoccus oleiagri TaxID=686624 RepID=A0A1G9HKY8_9ACTN|nr:FAD-dependent oxidoreductase [Tessaracoccus oleiagri]SDL13404.1 FAD dependent oxidoreductase [Tessaracoccus oleiagri]